MPSPHMDLPDSGRVVSSFGIQRGDKLGLTYMKSSGDDRHIDIDTLEGKNIVPVLFGQQFISHAAKCTGKKENHQKDQKRCLATVR